MYSYIFTVQHSSKLFEVSSICLDTRELVTLRNTAVLPNVTSSLITRVRKVSKQMEDTSNNLLDC